VPASVNPKVPLPLQTQVVTVDAHCEGQRWEAQNETHLARLIAIVASGQASHAAEILKALSPASSAVPLPDLYRDARIKLSIQEDGKLPRTGYPRWQRDGFMFEVISWIAARQDPSKLLLLLPPHISATAQGVDGLMIELKSDKSEVLATTIFEDKCSEDPRGTFRDKVMPAFEARHRNERSVELLAAASTLLEKVAKDGTDANQLAAAVMDRSRRRYRASFALTSEYDSQRARAKLFKDYDKLAGLSKEQRLGAGMIVSGELRAWFDVLADKAVAYIDHLLAECS